MIYDNNVISFIKEKTYRYIGQIPLWYDANDTLTTNIEVYSPDDITIQSTDIQLVAINKRSVNDKSIITYNVFINPDILPETSNPNHDDPDSNNVVLSFKESDNPPNVFSVYKYIEDIENEEYNQEGLVAPNVSYYVYIRTNTPLRVLGYKVMVSNISTITATSIYENIFS